MELSGFYSTTLTLFLLLAAGFLIRKLGLVTEQGSKAFSKLIICVGQPFMIVDALIKKEYSTENLQSGFRILLIGTCVHILIAVIAYVSVYGFRKPDFSATVTVDGDGKQTDRDPRKMEEFSLIFANCGFMGFPLLSAALGEQGLFYGAFYVVVFNVFVWTWGLVIVGRGRRDIRISPLKMLLNYGTLPSVIGIALYALQIPVLAPVAGAVSYLGSLCTPISMLITGGLLSVVPWKRLFCRLRTYYISAVKLLLLPLIVGVLAALCGLDDTTVLFLGIMTALPSASTSVMFSEVYSMDHETAAVSVGMTTLLSTATLPLVLLVLREIVRIL